MLFRVLDFERVRCLGFVWLGGSLGFLSFRRNQFPRGFKGMIFLPIFVQNTVSGMEIWTCARYLLMLVYIERVGDISISHI